jgi:hypothetical protein
VCSSRVCMYGALARHPSMDGTTDYYVSVSSTNNRKASNKASIIYPTTFNDTSLSCFRRFGTFRNVRRD